MATVMPARANGACDCDVCEVHGVDKTVYVVVCESEKARRFQSATILAQEASGHRADLKDDQRRGT